MQKAILLGAVIISMMAISSCSETIEETTINENTGEIGNIDDGDNLDINHDVDSENSENPSED